MSPASRLSGSNGGRAGRGQPGPRLYHFGTMPELVQAATRASVDDTVAYYRERFSEIGSLTELLVVGRELNEGTRARQRRDDGAADRRRPARPRRPRQPYAMAAWNKEIEASTPGARRQSPGRPRRRGRSRSGDQRELHRTRALRREVGVEAALDVLDTLGHLLEAVNGPGSRRHPSLRGPVPEHVSAVMTRPRPSVVASLWSLVGSSPSCSRGGGGDPGSWHRSRVRPRWFAIWLGVGVFGVMGAAQVLRWWARRAPRREAPVAMALGAAGLGLRRNGIPVPRASTSRRARCMHTR